MALSSITSGVNTTFSSQLNNNFSFVVNQTPKIVQLYTGSDANSSTSSTSTDVSTSASVELSPISASVLSERNFVKVSVFCGANASAADSGPYAYVQAKLRLKTLTGSYSDLFGFSTLLRVNNANENVQSSPYLDYVYSLSAQEKTSGVQVQLVSYCFAHGQSGNAASCSFSNRQVVVSVLT